MPPKPRSPVAPRPRRVPAERPGREGGKRDANRRARTADIGRAALALFLEHGVGAVTIDEIARAAGIAKGSFYRYFDGKDDLVDALVEPLAAGARAAFDRCAAALDRADSRGLAPAYLALAAELATLFVAHPDVVRLYLQECRAPEVGPRRPLVALAREIGDRAVVLTDIATSHGLLRAIDPRVTALAVVGAAERLLYGALSGDPLGDPASVARALVTMVLEGMAPGPRPGATP